MQNKKLLRKIYYRNSRFLSATIGSKTAENSRSWSAREPVFTKYELFYPIVKNLIENAIQYSQENGQITISYAIENQQLCLSVQDTGIGISQKTKNGSLNGSIVSIKHVAVILVAPV